jgi:hypothetical protein
MTEKAEQFDDRDQGDQGDQGAQGDPGAQGPQEQQEEEKKHGDPVLDIEAEAAAGGGPEMGNLTDEEAER